MRDGCWRNWQRNRRGKYSRRLRGLEGDQGGLSRLFDHPEVSAARVLAPHFACTEERLRDYPRVLCVQDTFELDSTTKKDIAGLGPLNYETRRGMYLHPTLALMPERVPLGLLDLYSGRRASRAVWVRRKIPTARSFGCC